MRTIVVSVIAFLSLAASTPDMAQDLHGRAVEYVRGLTGDCTLSDGYKCAEIEEDSFLHPDSWKKMVPAIYLRAWEVAYADFQGIEDLTEEQKDLRHYRVGFTEDDGHYIILIDGLLLPLIRDDGRPEGVVQSVFGRSTKYWVDKKALQVTKRLFMK